ncbi:response regulator [Stenotrophomonas sp. MMGLT7]|uniref:response regulator n=1 Tax=Stenotrophomonas sp. MMGLT7 TaxID=2901227 RepID=UPI001E55E173|nr:response regulator [Stenotrophomonas sp. MMGLT7]MCD7097108.1 ATP-binding protein [Stenotrophomonas sp. MMGLT7]
MRDLLLALYRRLARREDSEHAQTVIRIAIFCAVIAAMTIAVPLGLLDRDVYRISVAMSALGAAIGLGLLCWILLNPRRSDLRRVIGMVTDYGLMTVAMASQGEPLAWLYVILMWVTVGNGLRYGNAYLIGAVLAACTGFGIVLASSDYWRQNIGLGLGLWLGLAAIPLYLSGLLRRLTRATAEARRASEAKSRFLANMSHEFRTPLNGLSGMTDLLATTNLDAEQRECVVTIQASSRSLLALVEEVLDISAIEAGKLRVSKQDFSLRELIDAVGLILEPQARAKRLDYLVEVGSDVPDRLRGDPSHLRQILLNLAGNAVKFTDSGRVVVRVETVPPAPSSPREDTIRLRLEIADTGIGVPQEARGRLFEAFEQADVGMTRRYEGSGLGTTIAKGLAEAMGGAIGFQDNFPNGSRFWVELPFEAGAVEVPQAETRRDDTPPSLDAMAQGNVIAFADPFLRHRARVRSMHLLVADDHQANRMVLQRLLQKAGHRVTCVDGGEAVLDALADSDFDAAIVDLHMPGMSGLDLLKQLRVMQAGTSTMRTPVLVLSADVTPDAIRRCEQAGAHAFLAKPVASIRLLDVLAGIADRRNTRSGSGVDPVPVRPAQPATEVDGVLDPRVLDELAALGMGGEFEREFVRQCLEDAAECMRGIGLSGGPADWNGLRDHAHALRGVASNLGLARLAAQSLELMQMPDWQLRGEWRQRLATLEQYLEEGRSELHRRLRNGGLGVTERPGPG